MVTPLHEILRDAKANHYAVGCFNSLNVEVARGIIAAAERVNSPVILCHAQVHNKYVPIEVIGPTLNNLAKQAKVPVSILLDHGLDFDQVVKAMNNGFNAVMYDNSRADFEINLAETAEIVKIGHALGVSVEAELGHMPRRDFDGLMKNGDDQIIKNHTGFTDPAEAVEFAEKSKVDALAIAFGTMHGLYQEKPQLDFDRVRTISDMMETPLVMHGSSGLSDEDITTAIACGITKINYYSDMAATTASRLMEQGSAVKELYIHDVLGWLRDLYEEEAYKVISLFKNGKRG